MVWLAKELVILAVDYRGYADSYGGSSFETNECSMVQDGLAAFQFLKKYIHADSKLIVWGHSLGTGVTTKLAYELRETSDRPDGYVLESPFNTLKTEAGSFWLAKLLKYTIDVDKLIEDSNLAFDSERWIQTVKEPVFILHAEDDNIVPFEFGKRLFEVALEHSVKATFYPFERCLGLGHEHIHRADSLKTIIGLSLIHI